MNVNSVMLNDFLIAIALLFVIEGALYALAPGLMRQFMEQIANLPESKLRAMGLASSFLGVLLAWLIIGG